MSSQRTGWRGAASRGFHRWRRGAVILTVVLAMAAGHATRIWAAAGYEQQSVLHASELVAPELPKGARFLKDVSGFPGTYTRVKPEVVRAMGGSGRDPVFQNDQGVVVRVTRKIKMDYGLYVSLLGDSFKVTLRDF